MAGEEEYFPPAFYLLKGQKFDRVFKTEDYKIQTRVRTPAYLPIGEVRMNISHIPLIFMVTVGIAAGLGSISIWSPRSLRTKLLALICTGLFVPVAYGGFSDLLGRPKPVALEWWLSKADEATVLGSQMQEGQGLYLWLQVAGELEPRAYRMPWDQKAAQELQAALGEAQRNGTQARMRLPFERSLDQREPKFYAPPQLAMPPKDLAQPPAQIYQQPGQNA